jgi:hypothetical protein
MPTNDVVIVLLRQPRKDPGERRSDPFWEFGSFGTTGCHQRNLLHPKNRDFLFGKRLAFVQGGAQGFRLVYLTPPVTCDAYSDRCEVLWSNSEMPFRYADAPTIVAPSGDSDVPSLVRLISKVNRNGWMGRFASKFRSRKDPLPVDVAAELVLAYNRARRSASRRAVLARTYEEALPCVPPLVDRSRRKTYRSLRAALVPSERLAKTA